MEEEIGWRLTTFSTREKEVNPMKVNIKDKIPEN